MQKKIKRFILATMDYHLINNDVNGIQIAEREINEKQAQQLLNSYIKKGLMNFEFFGDAAEETWTVSIMTDLKPKAGEIQQGRLKWLLSTALPLNPEFELKFNGGVIESSKIKIPIMKKWIIGKDDVIADRMDGVYCHSEKENGKLKYYINLPNIKSVSGEFILYEDSLVEGKSKDLGRSHGIFLSIRGRLINLDDPLLGMEAFSHGAFNRVRIIINADELDGNLTSTREAVKDSLPFRQLKDYIKSKFNNEVKKYYFEKQTNLENERSISHRMSQTSYTTSKRPIYNFIQKYFSDKIVNPILIEKPIQEEKKYLLRLYEKDLETGAQVIEKIEFDYKLIEEPIAKLNLKTRVLVINKSHPYVANYIDGNRNMVPLESMIVTEVLTEAHLYELAIDEDMINEIVKRRDSTLRQLALADKMSVPAAVMFLKDSLGSPSALEEAVARALEVLGFEVRSIGGKNEPDGIAEAWLGADEKGNSRNYIVTYDAKSTSKKAIAAQTAHLSGLKRHRIKYNANFSLEVAIDYQGAEKEDSAVSIEANNEQVTMMTAKDLIKLILLATPKQIGLSKLRDLFETCHKPKEVSAWIDRLEKKEMGNPPYYDLVDVVYQWQKDDCEAPTIQVIRHQLNQKTGKTYMTNDVREWMKLLAKLVPGSITIDGDYVDVQIQADRVKERIRRAISDIPVDIQPLYDKIFK